MDLGIRRKFLQMAMKFTMESFNIFKKKASRKNWQLWNQAEETDNRGGIRKKKQGLCLSTDPSPLAVGFPVMLEGNVQLMLACFRMDR